MTQVLGIVNLTRDSFSDGGRFLEPGAALDHARALVAAGADAIDLGAESSHPDSEDVGADEEWRRIEPVLGALRGEGVPVSVDTWRPAVMARAVSAGASFVNDITGFGDPAAVEAVRGADARLIVMHSTAPEARAVRGAGLTDDVVGRVARFLERRVSALEEAGIERGRLILDPGMGFFLSSAAAPSLVVLRELPRLTALGLPVLVSTSRKSFVGEVLDRPVAGRGAGTLATELWAAARGAAWIRTHDVRALKDALAMWRAIEGDQVAGGARRGERDRG